MNKSLGDKKPVILDPVNLLSVSKAAKLLGVGTNRVQQLIKNKDLKIVEMGKNFRIPYSELQLWIANNSRYGVREVIPNLTKIQFARRSAAEILAGIKNGRSKV